MKNIFTLFIVFGFALSCMAETVFTFSSAADMSQTKSGITILIGQGTSSNAPNATIDYQTQEPEMRLYAGNTITVSSDIALTNIQMVFAKSSASNKQYTSLSASTGNLVSGGVSEDKNDWKIDSWTGNTTNVVFTLTDKGQRRIQKLVIDGEPVSLDSLENTLPTVDDLLPDYVYSEPTEVLPKDTTIWKEEYAFIDNNVHVYCNQGSIVKATDTTFAYFNCNADYSLTFTATQPIIGLEIDGYVRKAFNASCDHGTIQYLTDPDMEMEGWPAMVIMDINNTNVTLSCPKQLRCYSVRLYFKENPAPLFPLEGFSEIDDGKRKQGKILRNGQLLILHNNAVYNTQGIRIDNEQ